MSTSSKLPIKDPEREHSQIILQSPIIPKINQRRLLSLAEDNIKANFFEHKGVLPKTNHYSPLRKVSKKPNLLSQSAFVSPAATKRSRMTSKFSFKRSLIIRYPDDIHSSIHLICDSSEPTSTLNSKMERIREKLQKKRVKICSAINMLLSNKEKKIDLYTQAVNKLKKTSEHVIEWSSKKEMAKIKQSIYECSLNSVKNSKHRVWKADLSRLGRITKFIDIQNQNSKKLQH